MKNFDVENNANPFLVHGGLIIVENEIYRVLDMDSESILVSNSDLGEKRISNNEWKPIELTVSWLIKFNLEIGSKIRNTSTKLDWIIKTVGNIYYITIYSDYPYGDNPVIGLKYVHELQAWFFRLTKENLNCLEK